MNNELEVCHVMVLENTHPSSAEEWYCPTCGRRILLQWPPNYKKITLEAGDENALHSVGKGGLVIGIPDALQEQESSPGDDPRLTQWDVWLGQLGFDSWWNRKS